MLSQLSISNYTIVAHLDIELAGGMTVITGETGAGKSIMIDALGLCLGDRADPKAVRPGSERAEITAVFDIASVPGARDWLSERDLHTGDELLLRRVVTREGRSRAYINGTVSTLQDCADLGALLIDIHGQHAHQSLLRRAVQRELLDGYAGHLPLARQVAQRAWDWQHCRRELELLTGAREEHGAQLQLLTYQVEELDNLALADGELAALETDRKLLANAEEILRTAHRARELCEEQETGVRQSLQLLGDDNHDTAAAREARELLDSAAIQLNEARGEIQRHIDSVELDPERLTQVQSRLEQIYDIARKQRVMPEQLRERQTELHGELETLRGDTRRVEELENELAKLAAAWRRDAKKLGNQRRAAADKLAAQVSAQLDSLAMEQCELALALKPLPEEAPNPQGLEEVEILITTNPGAPAQPLGKIASGGELSRISLAIQVVTASTGTVPSMVFDEVDAGIGGAVAEVVGKLLRELASSAQVLCVTHLPQVAAQGQHHLQVTRTGDETSVQARLRALAGEDKVQEIARMLGGVRITEQTLAHAREMLGG
ncbi:MAG: DNA repair protein RecN [Halioglobus sp.]|nr:DNA repair protein RecN [Halioglobus sp.]